MYMYTWNINSKFCALSIGLWAVQKYIMEAKNTFVHCRYCRSGSKNVKCILWLVAQLFIHANPFQSQAKIKRLNLRYCVIFHMGLNCTYLYWFDGWSELKWACNHQSNAVFVRSCSPLIDVGDLIQIVNFRGQEKKNLYQIGNINIIYPNKPIHCIVDAKRNGCVWLVDQTLQICIGSNDLSIINLIVANLRIDHFA